MSKLVIIGLDPEYTRAGLAVYYDGKIVVSDCKTPPNAEKSYEQVFRDAYSQTERIKTTLITMIAQLGCYDRVSPDVYSECPPPQGNYASGLYGLDIHLHCELTKSGFHVYRLYPNFIDHVHGKRKSTKTEHVDTAMKILSHFEWCNLTGKKLNHDQADAVILLARGLASNGLLPKEVLDEYPNLNNEKERSLV